MKLGQFGYANYLMELLEGEDFETILSETPRQEITQPAPVKELVKNSVEVDEQTTVIPQKPTLSPSERNFSYAEGETLAPKSQEARIKANIAAVRLLKQIEADNRMATPEEKKVLATYTGWGGAKNIFNDTFITRFSNEKAGNANNPYYYDKHYYNSWKENYGEHALEINSLLDKSEWLNAMKSAEFAHYSPEFVAHAMWEIADAIGLDKGAKVLESSCGNGLLMGAAQDRDVSFVAVEKDAMSARLASLLYPQAKVDHADFADAKIAPASCDFALGNPPYSSTKPFKNNPKKLNLHNWFIKETAAKLKAGGYMVILTSSSTMDNNPDQRAVLAENLNLVGAIRLPNNAFSDTEVVSDLLVLRKSNSKAMEMDSWSATIPIPLKTNNGEDAAYSINEYFTQNPEMVLGVNEMSGSMHGRGDQYTVEPNGTDLKTALSEALAKIKEQIARQVAIEKPITEEQDVVRLAGATGDRIGNYVIKEGVFYQVAGDMTLDPVIFGKRSIDVGVPDRGGYSVRLPMGVTGDAAKEMMADYIMLRSALRKVIAVDSVPITTEEESQKFRKELQLSYNYFVSKWGNINTEGNTLERIVGDDPDSGMVQSLEVVQIKDDDGTAVRTIIPSSILTNRTIHAESLAHIGDLADGIAASLNKFGFVHTKWIGEQLEMPQEKCEKEMVKQGLAYHNPSTGNYEHRSQYLSSNVNEKLSVARMEAEKDPIYEVNIAALQSVKPSPLGWGDIGLAMGSGWIPPVVYEAFFHAQLGQIVSRQAEALAEGNEQWRSLDSATHNSRGIKLSYLRKQSEWVGLASECILGSSLLMSYRTDRVSGADVLRHAMANRRIQVFDTIKNGGSKTRVLNEDETFKANAQLTKLRAEFVRFVSQSNLAKGVVKDAAEDTLNAVVPPEYDGSFLTLPNMARGEGCMVPMKHQKNAIMRGITEQCGLIAHDVGYGKSLTGCSIVNEVKRLGIANKPLLVTDNGNYHQMVQLYRALFPSANVLAADNQAMNEKNRNKFLARAATGAFDVVIMTREQFSRMPLRDDTMISFMSRSLDDLKSALESVENGGGDQNTSKRIINAINRKEQELNARIEKMKTNSDKKGGICFEDVGFDFMIVDEFHYFKGAEFATGQDKVRGIDLSASNRGTKMMLAAQHIQKSRGGKGVIGMTATPATNSLVNIWNVLRVLAPHKMKESNIENFDDFFTTYALKGEMAKYNESSQKYELIEAVLGFHNGSPLINTIRSMADVKNDPNEIGLVLPKIEGGAPQFCVTPLTRGGFELKEKIADIYERWEKLDEKGAAKLKRGLSWIPITLMGIGTAAAVDPRLVEPSFPDDPESPVNRLVEEICKTANDNPNTTQGVALDKYRETDTEKIKKFAGEWTDAFDPSSIERVESEAISEGGATTESDNDPTDVEDAAKDKFEADKERNEYASAKFNLAEDLKRKLEARGLKVLTCYGKSKEELNEIYSLADKGGYIVIGSTKKGFTGANFQTKLKAVWHLDPPSTMNATDLQQRNGRIIRQGNKCDTVKVNYMAMMDTCITGIFDRMAWKSRMNAQIMAGSGVGNKFEDLGDQSLMQSVSVLQRDKRAMKRVEYQNRYKDLRSLQDAIASNIARCENDIARDEGKIAHTLKVELPKHKELHAWMGNNYAKGELHINLNGLDNELAGSAAIAATVTKILEEELNTKAEREARGEPAKEMSPDDKWKLTMPNGLVIKGEKSVKKVLEAVHQTISGVDNRRFGCGDIVEAGTITINGVPCGLRSHRAWNDNKSRSVSVCPNPPHLQKTDLKEYRIHTFAYTIGIVASLNERVEKTEDSIVAKVESLKKSVEQTKEALSKIEPFDVEELIKVRKQLEEVEKDLIANPITKISWAEYCIQRDRFASQEEIEKQMLAQHQMEKPQTDNKDAALAA